MKSGAMMPSETSCASQKAVSASHSVGQRRPVAVGAQTVSAACADVRTCDGRQLLVGVNKVHLLLNIGQRLAESGTGRKKRA